LILGESWNFGGKKNGSFQKLEGKWNGRKSKSYQTEKVRIKCPSECKN